MIQHPESCRAEPQKIVSLPIGNGETVKQCSDCGAHEIEGNDRNAETSESFHADPGYDEKLMLRGNITDVEKALSFTLAGNAYFTVRSRVTQNRFTFRVARPKWARKDQKDIWYLSLLSGPDNEHNYTYLGTLSRRYSGVIAHAFPKDNKSGISYETPALKAFLWLLSRLNARHMPSNVEFWHEGRCGRCGRKLTVPESIAAGIGPECQLKVRKAA